MNKINFPEHWEVMPLEKVVSILSAFGNQTLGESLGTPKDQRFTYAFLTYTLFLNSRYMQ